MKWIGIGVVAVVALAGVVLLVGSLLPAEHVAATRMRIDASRADVWAAITDRQAFPSWRSEVDSVRVLQPESEYPAWIERGRNGTIAYEQVSAEPPSRLVTRIADESLPFGGSWTFELVDSGGATEVTITEHGVVRNPVFRFMSRFVFGHHSYQESYLGDLARRFGHEGQAMRVGQGPGGRTP